MPILTKPYEFQRDCAIRIEKFGGRALLAMEQGLGKMYTSYLWKKRNPEISPTVIICPATLKWNWEDDLFLHFGVRASVLSKTKPIADEIKTQSNLVIINYDILQPWMEFLQRLDPQLIIIDECQYLGSKSSLRTKMVKKLCEGIPYVLALSGTPFTSKTKQLWPILNILKPRDYPNFYQYAHKHCNPKLTFWGWSFEGASNLDKLHKELIQKVMIRVLKKDVLKELPDKNRIIVPLEIEKRKDYEAAKSDFIKFLTKHNPAKAERANKAKGLVEIGYLKQLIGSLKLKYVMEWIDLFLEDSDEKICVFAVHKEVIERLKSKYKHLCVIVDGGVTGKDRQDAVNQFQNNSKTRMFIGNIKAAGVGLTLTAASTMAIIELGWTPAEHVQVEDRLHRIGTTQKVTCYYLVARDTIETKILKLIQDKQEVLSATLDGKAGGTDLDIYDLLTKELLKEGNENVR